MRRLFSLSLWIATISTTLIVQAQKDIQPPETFTANAQALGRNAGASAGDDPNRPVHQRERSRDYPGSVASGWIPGLPSALRSAPEVGWVEMNGRKTKVRWARQQPTDKGRTITIVTESPLAFVGGAAVDAKPRKGYEVAVIQLEVDQIGLGTGSMAAAARVRPGGRPESRSTTTRRTRSSSSPCGSRSQSRAGEVVLPPARGRLSLAVWSVILLAVSARALLAQTTGPVTPPDVAETSPPGTPDELGLRFHGYLRSGFGVDGTGKGQQPFIAPLAGAKYRLGNEAETHLETTFAYGTNSEDKDPAYFDTRITLAYVAPTSQSNTFATTFSLREAYALGRRLWEAQPNATFWAGARFYDRHDLHILDFWYRDPSGFGGGIEDIALGEQVKFAFSWIGGSQDQLDSNGTVPRDELPLQQEHARSAVRA